jgi:hypothetical protein
VPDLSAVRVEDGCTRACEARHQEVGSDRVSVGPRKLGRKEAMEGNGPTEGDLVEMGLILAGTDISGIWGVEEIRDSMQH